MARKHRHTNRNIFLLSFTILLVATFMRREVPLPRPVPEKPVPQGINHFITNELSENDETLSFEQTIERFMRQWEIVGASVAVMKEGKLVYSKGFGYANLEDSVKTDVFHIFRVASLSKLITATAVMKLSEEGKLRLSDRVFGEEGILNDSVYLGIRDRNVRRITVEHLLRHRAGYSIRAGDPLFNSWMVVNLLGCGYPIDRETMVRYAAASRLRYTPGSSNVYSNLGYVVLTEIVEKVSGMPYEQYVREKILAPIGCFDMHIGYSSPEKRFLNEVTYYESSDAEEVAAFDGSGRQVPRRYGGCDLQVLSGAGGWVASPTELLRLVSAIDPENPGSTLLKPETIRQMTAFTDDEYPIGWMKTTKSDDWSRSGSLAGTSAMLKRQHDGYTWILITNTSSWTGSRFPNKIAAMMNRAMDRVEEWPRHDLFLIAGENRAGEHDAAGDGNVSGQDIL